MPNMDNIIDLLQTGIRAEGLRQQAISSNIANMETPGYQRVEVKFEELLAEAMDSSSTLDLDDIEPEMFSPHDTPVKSNGNDVNLEAEIGDLVKNSLQHTAYVRILNKKLAQIENAIDVRS